MASNALAPKPKNALMQDPLQELLTKAAAYSQYNDLVNFLTSRQAMPEIKQEYLGPFRAGEFVYNGFDGPGRIGLSYGAEPSTLVHELTHAADRQLGNMSYDLEQRHRMETPFFDRLMGRSSLTPEEQRFVLARKKLDFDVNKNRSDPNKFPKQEFVNRLAPEWARKNYDYRANDKELSAYGMGGTVSPNVYNAAPLHIDPTMATEFSIMLDLAQRAQSKSSKK
jgi:hypothetical protein